MAALAFCVGAAYWPGIFSGSFMPKWWAMAIGLSIIPWGFRSLDPVIAACAASGVLMAALSLLVTPHLYGGTLQLIFIILLCGVAVGAAALEDVGPVIAALGWGVSISAVGSFLQLLGFEFVPHSGNSGFYLNSEVLAELAAPLFIWAFWSRRWALAGFMVIPLLICHSRVAAFAAACGMIFGLQVPRAVKFACVMVLVSVGVAAVFLIGDGPGKYVSGMSRIMYWGTALLSTVPSGRGLAWWAAAHPFPFEEFVHSDVLQSMVEIGLGAVFFLAIPVMVLQRSGGIAERAAYVGICIEALVSFPLHLPAAGFLAAVLTGYLARRRPAVCVAGSEGGMDSRGDVRWSAARAGGLGWLHGRGGVDVPVRSAYSEYADDRSEKGKGSA